MIMLFAIVILGFSFIPVCNYFRGHTKDYGKLYRIGQIALHNGDIYSKGKSQTFQFMYPPTAAILLAPLSALGLLSMIVIFILIHSTAWVASILLSAHLTTGQALRQHPLLYVVPTVCCIPYVWNIYLLGQPNLLLLACILGAFTCLQLRKEWYAGAFIALAAAIKAFFKMYISLQIRLFILYIVTLFMMGCTTFHLKPLLPSQIISVFEARTLDNPNLKKYLEETLLHKIDHWPQKSWNFTMLILAAFYYHPDLDIARAQWEVTKAGVITAGARPNPNISLVPYEANTLSIPIETAGKRGYRITQAQYLSEAARMNLVTVSWQVRDRLRTSLLNLYGAMKTKDNFSKQLEAQEEMVQLLKQRLVVGESSQFDLTQAHIALDNTRLSLYEVQKQIAERRVQLSDALGLTARALDGIDISLDFLEQPISNLIYQDIRSQALLNRSDILESIAKYEASQAALQLEIAKQYPNFNIGPGLLWNGEAIQWTLVFATSLPIFNRNQGPIAEAEARRTEMAERFASLQAEIIGEIDQAVASYHAAHQKLEIADSLLSNQKKQLQTMEKMLKIGGIDRMALLGTRLEVYLAEQSYLDALLKTQQSLGLLEIAIQKPINPSEPLPVIRDVSPRANKENNK